MYFEGIFLAFAWPFYITMKRVPITICAPAGYFVRKFSLV